MPLKGFLTQETLPNPDKPRLSSLVRNPTTTGWSFTFWRCRCCPTANPLASCPSQWEYVYWSVSSKELAMLESSTGFKVITLDSSVGEGKRKEELCQNHARTTALPQGHAEKEQWGSHHSTTRTADCLLFLGHRTYISRHSSCSNFLYLNDEVFYLHHFQILKLEFSKEGHNDNVTYGRA